MSKGVSPSPALPPIVPLIPEIDLMSVTLLGFSMKKIMCKTKAFWKAQQGFAHKIHNKAKNDAWLCCIEK